MLSLRAAVDDAYAAVVMWQAGIASMPRRRRFDGPQGLRFGAGVRGGFRLDGEGHAATVPIPKLGLLAVNAHRGLPGKPVEIAVSRDRAGRWWAALSCRVEVAVDPQPPSVAAIDLGVGRVLAHVVELADNGEVTRFRVPVPPSWEVSADRCRRLAAQRHRAKRGSKRHADLERRLALANQRLANQRLDHARVLAKRLLDSNRTVVVEGLDIKATTRNSSLHERAFLHAAWSVLLAALHIRAEATGRAVLVGPRYLATTQTCSVCLRRDGKKPLSMRAWTCPGCGTELDRDFNAAANLLVHAGLAGACPASARLALAATGNNTTHGDGMDGAPVDE